MVARWMHRQRLHARKDIPMRTPSRLFVLCAPLLAGCIYANVREPLAYRSPTPADVGGNVGQEVKGESCNHVILWLVAFGDGGYEAAVQDARKSANAAMIADVKADTTLLNVLSVYQRQCTAVTGRVASLTREPAGATATASP
jgi:hypothetical protein